MEPPAFDHPLDRDHPLGCEIRAIADGAAPTLAQLAAWLADQRFVLLVELNENPDPQAMQAWAVRSVPAIAFRVPEPSGQQRHRRIEGAPG